jgi:hypothetical protein
MTSRLSVTPGDIAACWRNTARLQDTAGKTEEAAQSRATAKRVSGVNAWVRQHGRRL